MRDADPTAAQLGVQGCECASHSSGSIKTQSAAAPSGIWGDPGAADSTLLKGIHRATPVGYLALFEAYGSLEVGARLKHPTSPVWVVCSESHFSVLFVCDEEQIITGESCVPGEDEACELYYYNGLASQEEVIRLSVTPLGGEQEVIPTGGVAHGGKPPLELVIGTRWGRCEVDWNGAERIL